MRSKTQPTQQEQERREQQATTRSTSVVWMMERRGRKGERKKEEGENVSNWTSVVILSEQVDVLTIYVRQDELVRSKTDISHPTNAQRFETLRRDLFRGTRKEKQSWTVDGWSRLGGDPLGAGRGMLKGPLCSPNRPRGR